MRASFFVLTGGFLTGVLWRSFFSISVQGLVVVLLLIVVVTSIGTLASFDWSTAYVALAVLAFLLGIIRTESAFQNYFEKEIFSEGETVSAVGTVVNEVDVRDDHAILYVAVDSGEAKHKTRLKVSVPQYPEFQYGDRVALQGVVRKPKSFETESGRIFNYVGYLMKENIQYEMRPAEVTNLHEQKGNPIISTLLGWKQSWLESISLLIPEPAASLAGGLVVGAKRSLGDVWLAAFRDTGIIHIVVLSGYNLTLVANSIVRTTIFLPRTIGLCLGVLGVAGFATMVGAGATVLRASIMAIIGMLSVYLVRPYMLLRALVLAAVVMVLWNPFVLVFDPGFQLSFLATIGLVFVSPHFEKYLLWVPEAAGLRGIVAATFATQLTVLPLLLYQIGAVSLVAPIVNVLILPFVPTVMALSFIAGVVGVHSIFFATPFAWLGYLLLSYMFLIVDLFSSVPFASVKLPVMSWWVLVVCYGVIPLMYWYKKTTLNWGGLKTK